MATHTTASRIYTDSAIREHRAQFYALVRVLMYMQSRYGKTVVARHYSRAVQAAIHMHKGG